MSDERRFKSVSGSPADEIDRQLTELLSIAPSPEFAARVREAVREERPSAPPRLAWWLGLAAAAAVVLVVMFAARSWRSADAPREVRTASDSVLPPVPVTVPVPVMVSAPSVDRGAQPRPMRVTARHSAPSEPEVLVSRDQLRALARLQEMLVKGQLTDKNLPPEGTAVTDIQPAPLAIAPLTLPAVEAGSGSEGSRPRSDR